MSFKDAVLNSVNEQEVRTWNGMPARATTASKVLDFFSQVGSLRGKDASNLFAGAFTEDAHLAMRALMWLRDVRGGAGERAQFRNLLTQLEDTNPSVAAAIMHKVPELGRWDDLLHCYHDPINRQKAFGMIVQALSEGNGLCAKWMPRKGPLALELREFMNLSPKRYRKLLVNLTKVVETQMCAKDWKNINFSQVPSLASARYQKAFGRNAPQEYANYIRELQKDPEDRDPNVKINASAVYPYDVIRSVERGNKAVANQQWKALPNYIGDAKILPMVDVSGSMWGTPLEVAVSLGLYCSEKNTSSFKDMFLTFSGEPEFVTVKGSLSQRINQMKNSHWGMNTNLERAMREILRVAVDGNVSQEDMPETLLILSDMQFDRCVKNSSNRAITMIDRMFEEKGYKRPKVVFWNLANMLTENTPVRFDEHGTALVSGFSPALMKAVLADDLGDYTPYNVMIKTLMDSRYNF